MPLNASVKPPIFSRRGKNVLITIPRNNGHTISPPGTRFIVFQIFMTQPSVGIRSRHHSTLPSTPQSVVRHTTVSPTQEPDKLSLPPCFCAARSSAKRAIITILLINLVIQQPPPLNSPRLVRFLLAISHRPLASSSSERCERTISNSARTPIRSEISRFSRGTIGFEPQEHVFCSRLVRSPRDLQGHPSLIVLQEGRQILQSAQFGGIELSCVSLFGCGPALLQAVQVEISETCMSSMVEVPAPGASSSTIIDSTTASKWVMSRLILTALSQWPWKNRGHGYLRTCMPQTPWLSLFVRNVASSQLAPLSRKGEKTPQLCLPKPTIPCS